MDFSFSGFFFRWDEIYGQQYNTLLQASNAISMLRMRYILLLFYFIYFLWSPQLIAMPHHSCFCTLETKQSLLSDRCMLPLLLSGWQPMACSHHQCLLVAPVAVPPHNDRNFISQRLVKGISLKRTVFFFVFCRPRAQTLNKCAILICQVKIDYYTVKGSRLLWQMATVTGCCIHIVS
jgi:hypothetical protein